MLDFLFRFLFRLFGYGPELFDPDGWEEVDNLLLERGEGELV